MGGETGMEDVTASVGEPGDIYIDDRSRDRIARWLDTMVAIGYNIETRRRILGRSRRD